MLWKSCTHDLNHYILILFAHFMSLSSFSLLYAVFNLVRFAFLSLLIDWLLGFCSPNKIHAQLLLPINIAHFSAINQYYLFSYTFFFLNINFLASIKVES